ncbi:predicted protein [Nematostella vectensis]|uniref:Uncharacterized protein n=1 Tax=Nematostella vectensis TaxID=45351 RepID=A7S836_NEMVE|nr:predicted protein [Nematostella vectensis]|eukprot:XP_001632185.1 predicted protein [Nematostella vectensis]
MIVLIIGAVLGTLFGITNYFYPQLNVFYYPKLLIGKTLYAAYLLPENASNCRALIPYHETGPHFWERFRPPYRGRGYPALYPRIPPSMFSTNTRVVPIRFVPSGPAPQAPVTALVLYDPPKAAFPQWVTFYIVSAAALAVMIYITINFIVNLHSQRTMKTKSLTRQTGRFNNIAKRASLPKWEKAALRQMQLAFRDDVTDIMPSDIFTKVESIETIVSIPQQNCDTRLMQIEVSYLPSSPLKKITISAKSSTVAKPLLAPGHDISQMQAGQLPRFDAVALFGIPDTSSKLGLLAESAALQGRPRSMRLLVEKHCATLLKPVYVHAEPLPTLTKTNFIGPALPPPMKKVKKERDSPVKLEVNLMTREEQIQVEEKNSTHNSADLLLTSGEKEAAQHQPSVMQYEKSGHFAKIALRASLPKWERTALRQMQLAFRDDVTDIMPSDIFTKVESIETIVSIPQQNCDTRLMQIEVSYLPSSPLKKITISAKSSTVAKPLLAPGHDISQMQAGQLRFDAFALFGIRDTSSKLGLLAESAALQGRPSSMRLLVERHCAKLLKPVYVHAESLPTLTKTNFIGPALPPPIEKVKKERASPVKLEVNLMTREEQVHVEEKTSTHNSADLLLTSGEKEAAQHQPSVMQYEKTGHFAKIALRASLPKWERAALQQMQLAFRDDVADIMPSDIFSKVESIETIVSIPQQNCNTRLMQIEVSYLPSSPLKKITISAKSSTVAKLLLAPGNDISQMQAGQLPRFDAVALFGIRDTSSKLGLLAESAALQGRPSSMRLLVEKHCATLLKPVYVHAEPLPTLTKTNFIGPALPPPIVKVKKERASPVKLEVNLMTREEQIQVEEKTSTHNSADLLLTSGEKEAAQHQSSVMQYEKTAHFAEIALRASLPKWERAALRQMQLAFRDDVTDIMPSDIFSKVESIETIVSIPQQNCDTRLMQIEVSYLPSSPLKKITITAKSTTVAKPLLAPGHDISQMQAGQLPRFDAVALFGIRDTSSKLGLLAESAALQGRPSSMRLLVERHCAKLLKPVYVHAESLPTLTKTNFIGPALPPPIVKVKKERASPVKFEVNLMTREEQIQVEEKNFTHNSADLVLTSGEKEAAQHLPSVMQYKKSGHFAKVALRASPPRWEKAALRQMQLAFRDDVTDIMPSDIFTKVESIETIVSIPQQNCDTRLMQIEVYHRHSSPLKKITITAKLSTVGKPFLAPGHDISQMQAGQLPRFDAVALFGIPDTSSKLGLLAESAALQGRPSSMRLLVKRHCATLLKPVYVHAEPLPILTKTNFIGPALPPPIVKVKKERASPVKLEVNLMTREEQIQVEEQTSTHNSADLLLTSGEKEAAQHQPSVMQYEKSGHFAKVALRASPPKWEKAALRQMQLAFRDEVKALWPSDIFTKVESIHSSTAQQNCDTRLIKIVVTYLPFCPWNQIFSTAQSALVIKASTEEDPKLSAFEIRSPNSRNQPTNYPQQLDAITTSLQNSFCTLTATDNEACLPCKIVKHEQNFRSHILPDRYLIAQPTIFTSFSRHQATEQVNKSEDSSKACYTANYKNVALMHLKEEIENIRNDQNRGFLTGSVEQLQLDAGQFLPLCLKEKTKDPTHEELGDELLYEDKTTPAKQLDAGQFLPLCLKEKTKDPTHEELGDELLYEDKTTPAKQLDAGQFLPLCLKEKTKDPTHEELGDELLYEDKTTPAKQLDAGQFLPLCLKEKTKDPTHEELGDELLYEDKTTPAKQLDAGQFLPLCLKEKTKDPTHEELGDELLYEDKTTPAKQLDEGQCTPPPHDEGKESADPKEFISPFHEKKAKELPAVERDASEMEKEITGDVGAALAISPDVIQESLKDTKDGKDMSEKDQDTGKASAPNPCRRQGKRRKSKRPSAKKEAKALSATNDQKQAGKAGLSVKGESSRLYTKDMKTGNDDLIAIDHRKADSEDPEKACGQQTNAHTPSLVKKPVGEMSDRHNKISPKSKQKKNKDKKAAEPLSVFGTQIVVRTERKVEAMETSAIESHRQNRKNVGISCKTKKLDEPKVDQEKQEKTMIKTKLEGNEPPKPVRGKQKDAKQTREGPVASSRDGPGVQSRDDVLVISTHNGTARPITKDVGGHDTPMSTGLTREGMKKTNSSNTNLSKGSAVRGNTRASDSYQPAKRTTYSTAAHAGSIAGGNNRRGSHQKKTYRDQAQHEHGARARDGKRRKRRKDYHDKMKRYREIQKCWFVRATGKHPLRWTSDDIDDVIIAGDAKHREAQRAMNLPKTAYLHIDELKTDVRVWGRQFTIKKSDVLAGNITNEGVNKEDPFPSIETNIGSLPEYNMYILRYLLYTIALFRTPSSWILFDSHSRDNQGFLIADGRSVLLEFKDINSVAKYLKRFVSCNGSSDPLNARLLADWEMSYELAGVQVALNN